jgi:predicted oxidoreductase
VEVKQGEVIKVAKGARERLLIESRCAIKASDRTDVE